MFKGICYIERRIKGEINCPIFAPKMNGEIVIFWFRRDLRLNDNHALYQALNSGYKVLPIFIFDKNILSCLPRNDKRVSLIYDKIHELNDELHARYQSGIRVFYDYPENAFLQILDKYSVKAVYTNKDYEPYAIERDNKITKLLANKGVNFYLYKDHVLFEENEVMKDDGSPYLVFTRYAKAWKQKLKNTLNDNIPVFPSEKYLYNLLEVSEKPSVPSLKEMNFDKTDYTLLPLLADEYILMNYAQTRNRIDMEHGTSHASVYLRFGMVSTRHLLLKGLRHNHKFLDELIWREFFQMILFHYPQSAYQNFKGNYVINWENNEKWFELWKQGKTGFPIIDAAMNELNNTGYMHNRCRMIVANFLTKILLIDWRWGEKYFAEKLMDYEMASNVGNWQWAAGTGVDAAPYFRIFNPYLQQEKFDPNYDYVKKWLPGFQKDEYIKPIVNYEERRRMAMSVLKA
jgi:deoxyribodipyrimidine photo-lyase